MLYPNTYYASTAIANSPREALTGDVKVDVCIIGAGIAGLSCALALIEQGKSVAILEREAVAWGASGRNGGLVMAGWAKGIAEIEKQLGLAQAQQLFSLSSRGVELIRDNIDQYSLSHCDVKGGQLQATRYPQREKLQAQQRQMADKYQYSLDFLETEQVREICRTKRYFEGLYSANAFHFHPLNYCLGLAKVLEKKGVLIFENSGVDKVTSDGINHRAVTTHGHIDCEQIVFCGGGYTGDEAPSLKRSFLPIATYMLLTEPLGDLAQQ